MPQAVRLARRAGAAVLFGAALLLGVQQGASAGPAPAGTALRNIASATYVPAGLAQVETVTSNPVVANVLPVEALVLTQDQNVTRPPATVVTLSHLLTNTGNVPSSYTIGFANNGVGCASDTLDLTTLSVVRDNNNNGVVDAGDVAVPLNSAGAITLQPGATTALLVQGTIPTAANGSACLALVATTALQGLVAVNHDIVTVGNVAVISLVKSASYPGNVIPGQTRIDFSLFGTNIGTQDAQPHRLRRAGSHALGGRHAGDPGHRLRRRGQPHAHPHARERRGRRSCARH